MAARIVLTTFGSLGDLHPFLALGLGLKARGHGVALATHEYYRSKIETAACEPPLVFTLGSAAVLTPGDFFAASAAAAQRLGRRAVLVGAEPQAGLPMPAVAARCAAEPERSARSAPAARGAV